MTETRDSDTYGPGTDWPFGKGMVHGKGPIPKNPPPPSGRCQGCEDAPVGQHTGPHDWETPTHYMNRGTGLNQWRDIVHRTAVGHGWWEGDTFNLPEKLALIHSEISEALEEYRNDPDQMYYVSNNKPEGIAVELADAIIRILDLCGKLDVDIESILWAKHQYNETRPHRHGGKVC